MEDIRNLFGDNKRKLLQTVDGVTGDMKVAQMWKHKYSGFLISVEDRGDKTALTSIIERLRICLFLVTRSNQFGFKKCNSTDYVFMIYRKM